MQSFTAGSWIVLPVPQGSTTNNIPAVNAVMQTYPDF